MVGIHGGRLTVSKRREELASVRPIDVLHVCTRMVAEKIRNCQVVLRRDGDESAGRAVGQLAELARRAGTELLGIEGGGRETVVRRVPAARQPGT